MKYKWQDVDWVELGCRGWEIDGTGAELDAGNDTDGAHLDRTTGHLMLSGSAAFCLRVFLDLRAARVPGYFVPRALTSTTTANTIGTLVPTVVEWGFP